MCLILSACQSTKASTEYGDDSSSASFSAKHQIRIQHDSGNRIYEVDGKRFAFDQLNNDQKKRMIELEEKMDKLELLVEIDGGRAEAWSEKMEAIAEQMELESEKFEDNVDDFEDDSQKLKEFSRKIAKASRNLEEKMSAIQVEMPEFDHKTIHQLEVKAEKMRHLLLEIVDDL